MKRKQKQMGKKRKAITEIFKSCQKNNDYSFDNNLVKKITKRLGFSNQFDSTGFSNEEKLPEILRENDYALIHLGNGKHRFIKGINKCYHHFEPIETTIDWPYKKSILNEYNTSESNILSVANNQRILHRFLFNKDDEFNNKEITKRPKTYFPHRTKTSFEYNFGRNLKVQFKKIQIEIDLTIEYKGQIAVFEGKNGKPKSFVVYQIYHPFLYYHLAKQQPEMKDKIKDIVCVYVVKQIQKGITYLKLWAYTFVNPLDITSIKLLKSICYKLNKVQ